MKSETWQWNVPVTTATQAPNTLQKIVINKNVNKHYYEQTSNTLLIITDRNYM
jgi:hypothetical protein